MVSYPQQVAHKHWEANWQGSRPQSSISPLIRHSEDHNHELQSQEYLYSGGHSQTDAWLKLKAYIHIHFTNNSEIVIKYIYCTLFYLCEIAFLQQVLWLCFDISMVSNIDQSFCITSKQAIVSTNELTKTNTPSYRVQAKIASHIARCDPIQHSGSSQSSQALSTDVEERTKQGQLGANQVGERDSRVDVATADVTDGLDECGSCQTEAEGNLEHVVWSGGPTQSWSQPEEHKEHGAIELGKHSPPKRHRPELPHGCDNSEAMPKNGGIWEWEEPPKEPKRSCLMCSLWFFCGWTQKTKA